jgi:hypothetical protein
MPAPPLALTDSQLTTIMQLSRPLLPAQRIAFLEMLAAKLNGSHRLGRVLISRPAMSAFGQTGH